MPLTLEDVFSGAWSFLLLDILTVALPIVFPDVMLFLPKVML